jgi:hypothetical protein
VEYLEFNSFRRFSPLFGRGVRGEVKYEN